MHLRFNMVLVSVIMPTYNTPYEHLKSAVESIKNQTYNSFELLIINDGSTEFNDVNEWNKIIGSDPRIRIINNSHKKGVAGSLNTGLDNSIGKYIIRMDADDISLPDRINKQVQYMESHEDIDLLAGYTKCFGASNKTVKPELNDTSIRTALIFQCGLPHPTICLRKETLDKYDLFYSEDVQSEDYELWTRCALIKDFRFAALPSVLLKYRIHEGQVSNTRKELMTNQGRAIRLNYINHLGINLNNDELYCFIDYVMMPYKPVNLKRIYKIESTICSEISKWFAVNQRSKYMMSFWRICAKKSVLHAVKGQAKHLFLAFLCFFRCFFSFMHS